MLLLGHFFSFAVLWFEYMPGGCLVQGRHTGERSLLVAVALSDISEFVGQGRRLLKFLTVFGRFVDCVHLNSN